MSQRTCPCALLSAMLLRNVCLTQLMVYQCSGLTLSSMIVSEQMCGKGLMPVTMLSDSVRVCQFMYIQTLFCQRYVQLHWMCEILLHTHCASLNAL